MLDGGLGKIPLTDRIANQIGLGRRHWATKVQRWKVIWNEIMFLGPATKSSPVKSEFSLSKVNEVQMVLAFFQFPWILIKRSWRHISYAQALHTTFLLPLNCPGCELIMLEPGFRAKLTYPEYTSNVNAHYERFHPWNEIKNSIPGVDPFGMHFHYAHCTLRSISTLQCSCEVRSFNIEEQFKWHFYHKMKKKSKSKMSFKLYGHMIIRITCKIYLIARTIQKVIWIVRVTTLYRVSQKSWSHFGHLLLACVRTKINKTWSFINYMNQSFLCMGFAPDEYLS